MILLIAFSDDNDPYEDVRNCGDEDGDQYHEKGVDQVLKQLEDEADEEEEEEEQTKAQEDDQEQEPDVKEKKAKGLKLILILTL